jgi:hypothetical protein
MRASATARAQRPHPVKDAGFTSVPALEGGSYRANCPVWRSRPRRRRRLRRPMRPRTTEICRTAGCAHLWGSQPEAGDAKTGRHRRRGERWVPRTPDGANRPSRSRSSWTPGKVVGGDPEHIPRRRNYRTTRRTLERGGQRIRRARRRRRRSLRATRQSPRGAGARERPGREPPPSFRQDPADRWVRCHPAVHPRGSGHATAPASPVASTARPWGAPVDSVP